MRTKKAAQRARAAHRRRQERARTSGGDTPEQVQAQAQRPDIIAGAEVQGSAPWIEAQPGSLIAPPLAEQELGGSAVVDSGEPGRET